MEAAGRVRALPVRRIDSAHSTWLFDTDEQRFVRLPKGVDPSSLDLDDEWRPYFGLEIETSGAFTVALNPERTKLLRAWREDPEPTAELELLPDDVATDRLRS
jgi:hypothetical protein